MMQRSTVRTALLVRRHTRLAGLAALLLCTACAALATTRPGPPAAFRGVPGFDTRDYPGDAAMRGWRDASPYHWVGYYLPAPCYTGTTWSGRRGALRAMGWGFAVLYVGEQDWSAMRATVRDTVAVRENPRCTRANLTAARGAVHAAEAASAAAADNFPAGTIIFLDVERVDRVSAELSAYIRGWAAALLADRRYVPGLYAHDVNAAELYTIFAEEFRRRQRADKPALWVAKTGSFELQQAPAESGHADATIWQGMLNVRESWSDVTLRIDVNVATSADPSRGR